MSLSDFESSHILLSIFLDIFLFCCYFKCFVFFFPHKSSDQGMYVNFVFTTLLGIFLLLKILLCFIVDHVTIICALLSTFYAHEYSS